MTPSMTVALLLTAVSLSAQPFPTGPARDSGQSVTPAFEGWFPNPDGSFSILFGYYNRNQKQELDIPVGQDNRVEPGGPDRGQPTHFLVKRRWGVFAITVPRDFGSGKVTWTLVTNGKPISIPASLDPLWEIAPFKDATGNMPPFMGFSMSGPFVQGPAGQSISLTAVATRALTLPLWVADDANLVPGAAAPKTPAVAISWSKFRGSGPVRFSEERPAVVNAEFGPPPRAVFLGKATTTVTFEEPGEYTLAALANDWSGEGGRGFQCCWSNAQVKVTVTPSH
jgi:hypothetical protein